MFDKINDTVGDMMSDIGKDIWCYIVNGTVRYIVSDSVSNMVSYIVSDILGNMVCEMV